MSEIKDDSNPMSFDLKIHTDEQAYLLFDELFEKRDHVSLKNASLTLADEPADTTFLKNETKQPDNFQPNSKYSKLSKHTRCFN